MKVFYVIILLLWITATILLHQIDGVNLTVWYALATPFVIIRLVRAVLLIKTKSYEKDF
jgi:hypothetical protein